MRVEISKDVFQNADFNGLIYIFQILTWSPPNSIARYELFIDTEKIKDTQNFQKLAGVNANGSIQSQIMEDEFNNSILESSRPDYYVTNKKGDSCYSIEEAIRFFSQPVSIILENSKNDAKFIEAIIHYFDSEKKAMEHLKNGWIKFENAGGYRNVKNFLEGMFNSYNDLAARYNKDNRTYFRGIVILDSDKNYEDAPEKPQYRELKDSFGEKIIYPLNKRAMENYMPIQVFEDLKVEIESNKRGYNNWEKMIDWINVYLNLTAIQKSFINISDGFPKYFDKDTKTRNPIKPEILSFFEVEQELENTRFKILDEGFVYKGKDFKNEFPLLFMNSSRVNKHTLKEQDGINELEEILNKIYSLL